MIISNINKYKYISNIFEVYKGNIKYTTLLFDKKKHFKEMVKMSVLADCLKKIVNAEKSGKRQVNI